ncbi:MAG: helix-turn-helix domain-containing protein [Bacteroidaceae bacterium]|nr:helix-turn-helix domain-containing protein [Bacteroidaceae bacterium]
MKVDFQYSTDFYAANSPTLSHTCLHLLCTAGEGSFVFNEKPYRITKNDLVVIPMPNKLEVLKAGADLLVEWFAADYKFLQALLPSNNYSIGGSISLNQNPVISLTAAQADCIREDFQRLCSRMGEHHLMFYCELMGSLCLTLIYDIFEAHARRDTTEPHTDRAGYIVKQLMDLLSTGISRTEREVAYYANRIGVSPKYLSETVRRMTGHNVTSYINRHTIPILKEYLADERLSLSQIADRMNFNSLSYFSRYCTKHLGISPGKYRQSLQPKYFEV